jgi:hypothetical protein
MAGVRACSTRPASQIDPAETPPAGTTLSAQLAYLQASPSLQYNEPGPYGGIPGIFLQFTREARLNYSVSVVAVSSATLTGYLNNVVKPGAVSAGQCGEGIRFNAAIDPSRAATELFRSRFHAAPFQCVG